MEQKRIQSFVTYANSVSCFMSFFLMNIQTWGFPGGTLIKNLPANAGEWVQSPGLGRSPGG